MLPPSVVFNVAAIAKSAAERKEMTLKEAYDNLTEFYSYEAANHAYIDESWEVFKEAAQRAATLNTTSASTPLPCDGCHLEYGCIECSTCGVWINRKRK